MTGNRVIELYLHILLSVSVDLQFLLRALASITKRKVKTSKLESTELEHRPIVSTYKLLKNLNPSANFSKAIVAVEMGFY